MKTILFSLTLLLTCLSCLTAQERFLPVSSASASAVATLNEASVKWTNGEFAATTVLIRKALAQDPDLFMGYVFLTMSDPAGATEEGLIDKALAIDPANFNEAELLQRDLMIKLKADPTTKATATLKAIAAAYPNNIHALVSAGGNAYFADGNPKLALEYALKLADLSPDFAVAYNMMGYCYMETGNMAKAKASFDKYLQLSPDEANPYDSMADYYMAAKDYDKAAKYYDKAVARGMASSRERADKARGMKRGQTGTAFNLATAKTEIEAANKKFMALIARGDAPGIANVYTPDGKVMFTGAPAVAGQANIQALFAGIINSGVTRISLKTAEVFGTEDLLAEEGEVTVYVKDQAVAQEKYIVLWKKVAGEWKMFRDIANSNSPAE